LTCAKKIAALKAIQLCDKTLAKLSVEENRKINTRNKNAK